jgi:transcriptional regulator with XRE-family HTH domain
MDTSDDAPHDTDDTAAHLARNLASLRRSRSLTQDQLAKAASVPRSTIANLESGSGNPSLQVLVKVARALGSPIDELLSPPRAKVRKYAKGEIPELRRAGRGVVMRPLVPEPTPEELLALMELDEDGVMGGTPHLPGTREYFTLLDGHVEIVIAGTRFEVKPGEVLAFPGNVPHSYRNLSRKKSRGVSVVVLSRSGV